MGLEVPGEGTLLCWKREGELTCITTLVARSFELLTGGGFQK